MNQCINCTGCFLCNSFSDRDGVIAEGTQFRLLADRSPVSAVHWLIASLSHVTSLTQAVIFGCQPVSWWNIVDKVSSTLSHNTLVLEHGGNSSEGLKGCIAHAHAHLVYADSPLRALDKIKGFLSGLGELKQFLTLQEFASFIAREELPENFIWAASPGDHSFLFVTLKSCELRQLARKALCFALSTDYLPYEDAVNVVRARELTALGRALVDQDEFSIAEKSIGPIILIEGLSATGKTTVSRKIAEKLGGVHIPSGLYYCSLAVYVEKENRGFSNRSIQLNELYLSPITEAGATEPIRLLAAKCALNEELWTFVASSVCRDSTIAQSFGCAVVIDARGYSKTVLGSADVKIFLTASPKVRKRRAILRSYGRVSREAFNLVHIQVERDRLDITRRVGKTEPACDSLVIRTDQRSAEEVANQIVHLVVDFRPLPLDIAINVSAAMSG